MPRLLSWTRLVSDATFSLCRQVLTFAVGQDFRRVGLSTLTDLLNVVAPPISEHEVIQVWLSHDMQGYEGVETLVYRAFARVSFLGHALFRMQRLT